MIRDDAIAILKRRLGNRTDLDDAILQELKLQQVQLEHQPSLPWFLLSEISTATLETGDDRLALPVDFLREPEEESALWLYLPDTPNGNPWLPLAKESFDSVRARAEGPTRPRFYSISGDYFRILPAADKDYTVKMMYFAKAQTLDVNVENRWLKHSPAILIAQTGVALAGFYNMQPQLTTFAAELQTAKAQLAAENTARQEANRTRMMGTPP